MIERRTFIAGLGSAAAWPLAARAQQGGRVRWIGVLMAGPESDPGERERTAVFEQSLEKLGWVVGRNLAIDYRWEVNQLEMARSAVA
jgi:putative ABC transport system substrate-binding protein